MAEPKYSNDPETEEFCRDLLQGVRDIKDGRAVRKTLIRVSEITAIRHKTGLTQEQFARLLGVSVRTLQAWEQGVRQPSGAAQTVLRIADRDPKMLANLALSA